MLALARRIVGGVAHEDGDALVGEPLLQRLDDREGEAAETVVGDDADGARLGAMQALRQVVRPVADLAGDAQHLFAGLLAQPAAGVERLRGGADRHFGEPRDVADGRRAAKAACRPAGVRWAADRLSIACYLTAPLRRPDT